MGINLDIFERARLATWQLSGNKGGMVKNFYDLIQYLEERFNFPCGPCYFHGYRTKDNIEPTSFDGYSLYKLKTSKGRRSYVDDPNNTNCVGDTDWMIWLDGPIGLGIMYKGIPNAVVAFYPSNKKTLLISQLQGVRPGIRHDKNLKRLHSRGLAKLDWQRLLVDVVEHVTIQLGYTRLGIQGGNNNIWTRPNEYSSSINLPLERAIELYDRVAARLGFSEAPDKNWYKNLYTN